MILGRTLPDSMRWPRAARLCSSPPGLALISAALAIVTALLLRPLIDPYYRHVFEPDMSANVDLTVAFMSFLSTWRLDLLPRVESWPPYLDACWIIYALFGNTAQTLARWGWITLPDLATPAEVATFAIRHCNVLAHSLAVIPVFFSARMVSRRVSVSAVAALLFAFAPQWLGIDILRLDRVILLLFCTVLWLAMRLASRPFGVMSAIALGIAWAALACTKMTSVAFSIVPFTAFALAALNGRFRWSTLIVTLLVAEHAAAVLSIRHLSQLASLPQVLSAMFGQVGGWNSAYGSRPFLYYNWHSFQPAGFIFPLFCIVTAVAAVWLWISRRRLPAAACVVIASLLIFSALGIPAIKYPRGSYILIPLYFIVAALGMRLLWQWSCRLDGRRALLVALAAWLPFATAGALCIQPYREAVRTARHLKKSTSKLRTKPREWLRQHAPPGTRVAIIIHSNWALPHLDGLRLDVSPALLDFPYLESARMASFDPPDLATLAEKCDLILLSDFHPREMLATFERAGQHAQVEKWRAFFTALDTRFQTLSYESERPNYSINSVKIHIVNPAALKNL